MAWLCIKAEHYYYHTKDWHNIGCWDIGNIGNNVSWCTHTTQYKNTEVSSIYGVSTGNSNTTSLLVNEEYTLANVSSLVSTWTWSLGSRKTFKVLDPSSLCLILLPTISVGYTMSSRMASWTAVRVLDLDLGAFWAAPRLEDLERMVRWPMMTTWRPL